MTRTIRVETQPVYEVHVGAGLLLGVNQAVARYSAAAVLTDTTVGELYLELLGPLALGPIVRVAPGEQTKCFAQLETILDQLLKEPKDYIQSCIEASRKAGIDVRIDGSVTIGHHLAEYRRLVDENDVDLLVMHVKEDDQMAMHGLAYALAVELRHVPLLML